MWIERPPKLFRKLFPGALFRIEPGESAPKVYLTFDDGPIPEVTPWVLDTLDVYGIKATFFMVGQNIERNPDLLEEVIKRGHKVGNHTHRHIRGIGISPQEYMEDVEACARLADTSLFRPPHGWLTPGQLKAVEGKYKIVMYDLVTRDYSKKITAEEVSANVRKYARAGSIIVFHDSLKSFEKLKTALPESIEWLAGQGYEFALI